MTRGTIFLKHKNNIVAINMPIPRYDTQSKAGIICEKLIKKNSKILK